MKRIAFFIALLVGLNATPVVRKPEEEENQVVVQTDDNYGKKRNHSTIISIITDRLMFCFYAITKEGRMDIIDWERISKLFKCKDNQIGEPITHSEHNSLLQNKVNWIQINYQFDGNESSFGISILTEK